MTNNSATQNLKKWIRQYLPIPLGEGAWKLLNYAEFLVRWNGNTANSPLKKIIIKVEKTAMSRQLGGGHAGINVRSQDQSSMVLTHLHMSMSFFMNSENLMAK